MATVARERSARRLSIERAGDGSGWVARVEGVDGAAGEGDTPAAAAAAADALLDADGSYSGRLLLRMPRTLHAELARRADAAQVSLNQLLVGTLADTVAAAPGRRRLPRGVKVALAVDAAVVAAAVAIAALILAGVWR